VRNLGSPIRTHKITSACFFPSLCSFLTVPPGGCYAPRLRHLKHKLNAPFDVFVPKLPLEFLPLCFRHSEESYDTFSIPQPPFPPRFSLSRSFPLFLPPSCRPAGSRLFRRACFFLLRTSQSLVPIFQFPPFNDSSASPPLLPVVQLDPSILLSLFLTCRRMEQPRYTTCFFLHVFSSPALLT